MSRPRARRPSARSEDNGGRRGSFHDGKVHWSGRAALGAHVCCQRTHALRFPRPSDFRVSLPFHNAACCASLASHSLHSLPLNHPPWPTQASSGAGTSALRRMATPWPAGCMPLPSTAPALPAPPSSSPMGWAASRRCAWTCMQTSSTSWATPASSLTTVSAANRRASRATWSTLHASRPTGTWQSHTLAVLSRSTPSESPSLAPPLAAGMSSRSPHGTAGSRPSSPSAPLPTASRAP